MAVSTIYEAPKPPAMLLAGLAVLLALAYIAALWLDEDFMAELASGFLGFTVLLLSAYIGFAGGKNLALRPASCFLNGAFVSGVSFLLLFILVSVSTVLMGKSLVLEATMLIPVVLFALAGGVCGLLGWAASAFMKRKR